MRLALALTFSLSCVSFGAVAAAQDDEPTPDDITGSEDILQPNVAPPTAPVVRTPEDIARRAHVVARVGDVRITVAQVEDAVNEQSPFLRVRYREPEQLRSFVDSLVRFELLARAAVRADIHEDPEVQQVVKQNAVQQLIRRDFDERITVESVPEANVRQYYDSHPEEFGRTETRRAAHIALASRADAERLMARAQEADARAFRELAREESTDPETRLRGGDLRYFDDEGRARNERDPRVHEAIARAAFALAEVGNVSPEPVQVEERWSIVKLTGMRPAEHRSYEQAAPTIRLRLWRETRQEGLEELVARLRREAGVEVNYELLAPIRLDPAEREDAAEGHGDGPGAVRPPPPGQLPPPPAANPHLPPPPAP